MQAFIMVGDEETILKDKVMEMVGKDLLYVVGDEEKTVGIEVVRKIISDLKSKSYQKRWIWIKRGDKLTHEAQNSLLKILEEPPQKTAFVITTFNLESLLATIRSRCQIIKVLTKKSKNEKFLNELTRIMKMGIDERLVYGEKFKDRIEVERWFKEMESSLLTSWKMGKENEIMAQMIQDIWQAREYLKRNGNVRLVVNEWLLGLPRLKS